MNTVLYPRQRQILNYINQYIDSFGTAPSLTEIKNHIGVKTLSTVHEHLAKLEAKGLIEKVKDTSGLYFSIKDGAHQGSLIQIPLVGIIAAGKPILAVEVLGDAIQIPSSLVGKRKNVYCLKVKGDSMIESMIADGDVVVVEKTDLVHNGDTVVALLDDETATLKRFYKEKNYVRLKPANPAYKDILVDSVTIQGKVIAIFRTY
jgi:repressor LexA